MDNLRPQVLSAREDRLRALSSRPDDSTIVDIFLASCISHDQVHTIVHGTGSLGRTLPNIAALDVLTVGMKVIRRLKQNARALQHQKSA